jgi:hypothetical protein
MHAGRCRDLDERDPEPVEPSMTSFRMVWIWGIGVMPNIFAMVRQTESASLFIGAGGSSSFSTRQVVS